MFREKYKDLQYIVLELELLRKHNSSFSPGKSNDYRLLFSQVALTLLCLERFLRILPGVEEAAIKRTKKGKKAATLAEFLRGATDIKILAIKNKDEVIKQVTDVRNSILHGNFEQCARECNKNSVEEYFKLVFAGEVEALYKFTKHLMDQINSDTGKRYEKVT